MRCYREQKNNAQTFSRAFSWANNRVCFSFKASCWNIPTSELTCFNVSTCSSVKPSSALLLSCSWCASNVGNSGKLKWIRYLGEPLKFKVSFISLIQRRKSTIKHDLKGLLKQLLNLPLGVIGNVSVVSTVILYTQKWLQANELLLAKNVSPKHSTNDATNGFFGDVILI